MRKSKAPENQREPVFASEGFGLSLLSSDKRHGIGQPRYRAFRINILPSAAKGVMPKRRGAYAVGPAASASQLRRQFENVSHYNKRVGGIDYAVPVNVAGEEAELAEGGEVERVAQGKQRVGGIDNAVKVAVSP